MATRSAKAHETQRMTIEPRTGTARARFNGETLAESDRALVLRETGYPPRVYFPPEDVRTRFLERSDHATHCPHKGDARYWSLRAGDASAPNAAWAYPEPLPGAESIKGYISFLDPVEVDA